MAFMDGISITLEKGKRKKRAHKKFLKKPSVKAWLKNIENRMNEMAGALGLGSEVDRVLEETATYGSAPAGLDWSVCLECENKKLAIDGQGRVYFVCKTSYTDIKFIKECPLNKKEIL